MRERSIVMVDSLILAQVQQHKHYALLKEVLQLLGLISEAAVERARKIYANEKNVKFIIDDILNSNLNDNEFDYIFDRGCFHVLSPANRQEYIRKIKRIL